MVRRHKCYLLKGCQLDSFGLCVIMVAAIFLRKIYSIQCFVLIGIDHPLLVICTKWDIYVHYQCRGSTGPIYMSLTWPFWSVKEHGT